MSGIPSKLYKSLREVLIECEQFGTNRRLRTFFTNDEINIWRNSLPQAETLQERVDVLISYLHDKYRRDGANGLALFIRVLSENFDQQDVRHDRLLSLEAEVINALERREFSPSKSLRSTREKKSLPIDSSSSGLNSNKLIGTLKKDFFISYNHHDMKWAEWVAWQLEDAGYTTLIQAWDFRPGSNFVVDMQKSIAQTKRIIAILSPDYLASKFAQSEWSAAFAKDPTGEKGLLVPVRVQECNLEGLLPQIVYIDFVGLLADEAKNALLDGVKYTRAKPPTSPKSPSAIGITSRVVPSAAATITV